MNSKKDRKAFVAAFNKKGTRANVKFVAWTGAAKSGHLSYTYTIDGTERQGRTGCSPNGNASHIGTVAARAITNAALSTH